MQKKIAFSLSSISLGIFYGLLAYMPLHIFISTVIGANIGGLAVMKVLKDVVMMFGFCSILIYSVRQSWFKDWLKNKLVIAVLLYGLLTVVLALVRPTDLDAEILGVTYNLRFLVFLLYAWLLVKAFPKRNILETSIWIVLVTGVAVSLFGVIQYVVLPDNALTHLGFVRSNGVLPAFFIDDKPDLERVMSTLRDPNSLGSYLIILASLTVAARANFSKKSRKMWLGVGMLTLLCLLLTFSRSALLGLCVAIVVGIVLVGKDRVRLSRKQIRLGLLAVAALAVIGIGSLAAFRNSYVVQNVIFHADQSTTLEDPNELRIRFIRESIDGVIADPLGSGPGTAGLASIRNNVQGTQLNENYYLQIATEVGILGLILFMTILVLTAVALYKARKNNPFAIALLASFAGLALTNVLVHIWSNETVAYTWWGLAGLLTGGQHFTTTKKTKSYIIREHS